MKFFAVLLMIAGVNALANPNDPVNDMKVIGTPYVHSGEKSHLECVPMTIKPTQVAHSGVMVCDYAKVECTLVPDGMFGTGYDIETTSTHAHIQCDPNGSQCPKPEDCLHKGRSPKLKAAWEANVHPQSQHGSVPAGSGGGGGGVR